MFEKLGRRIRSDAPSARRIPRASATTTIALSRMHVAGAGLRRNDTFPSIAPRARRRRRRVGHGKGHARLLRRAKPSACFIINFILTSYDHRHCTWFTPIYFLTTSDAILPYSRNEMIGCSITGSCSFPHWLQCLHWLHCVQLRRLCDEYVGPSSLAGQRSVHGIHVGRHAW